MLQHPPTSREASGEVLHVIRVQAGRSAMQILHWETAPPAGIANDQYRYSLTDHLGPVVWNWIATRV